MRAGDRVLVCSDGLTNEVDDRSTAAVLRAVSDPQLAADELISAAMRAGGRDDATALVIDVVARSVPGQCPILTAHRRLPRFTPVISAVRLSSDLRRHVESCNVVRMHGRPNRAGLDSAASQRHSFDSPVAGQRRAARQRVTGRMTATAAGRIGHAGNEVVLTA